MRLRSLLALFFISFLTLGLSGCGSSGNDTEFVVTTAPQTPNTGNLTFNFVTAQSAFLVDADTARLRFDFFENAGALGDPVVTATVDFQPQVTIQGLITSIQSVKITGLDANNIPLYTITQSVTVVGGQTTVVPAAGDVVPVTLVDIQLVSSAFDPVPLESVDLEVGGTGQVSLLALYSDGSIIVVGDAATYSNDPNDPNGPAILQVGEFGQLRGLSAGTTNLIVSFGGQEITVPVNVTTQLSVTFSEIDILNTEPVSVAAGSTAQLSVAGVRASDGFVFGISQDNTDLTFSISGAAGISVDQQTGLVTVLPLTPGGAQATVTASFLNSNGTTVTDTATVVVSGAAGVESISVASDRAELYSGAPNLTATLSITETLTDQTTQIGTNTDYDFVSSNEAIATVDANGVVTPVGGGTVTITATNLVNPNLTSQVDIVVNAATVLSADITPGTATVSAGGSQAYTLNVTFSNTDTVDVTNLSTFTVSNTGDFSVAGSTVTASETATTGDATTVTGTFVPGGNASDALDTATLSVL